MYSNERIPERLSDASFERRRLAQQRRGDQFIAGPIPIRWVSAAAAVSATAVLVGLALWFRAGCEKSRTVRAGQSLWSRSNISRHRAYRALAALESAELVRVERHRGRNPIVTILQKRTAN